MYDPSLLAAVKEVFKPKENITPAEWAEKFIYLYRQTSRKGRYSLDTTPYMREILNTLNDRLVDLVVMCFGCQLGKTLVNLIIATAYRIVNDPTPCMIAFPTRPLAQKFSENRWREVVEHCEPLNELKPSNEDDFKTLLMHFQSCDLELVGLGNVDNANSSPIGFLRVDEFDGEVTNMEDVLLRTNAYKGTRQTGMSGTPKCREGIWKWYRRGTMERYEVQCPHCKEWITFEWRNSQADHLTLAGPSKEIEDDYNIRWDPSAKRDNGDTDMGVVQRTARYHCQRCRGVIEDGVKTKLLREGRWSRKNFSGTPGNRSFHLSSLYSPDFTWGELAVRFLQYKQAGELRLWDESYVALPPWEEVWEKPDVVACRKAIALDTYRFRERPVKRGPDGVDLLPTTLMAVDVQKDGLWMVIRDFYPDATDYLIDCGMLMGFEDIQEKMKRWGVLKCGIDSRYVGPEIVYPWCAKNPRDIWSIRTWDHKSSASTSLFAVTSIDPRTGDPVEDGAGIYRLSLDDNAFFRRVVASRSGQDKNFYAPADAPTEYYEQLCDEYFHETKDKHGKVRVERKENNNNHMGDCEKYIKAMAQYLGSYGVLYRKPKPTAPAVAPRPQPAAGRAPVFGERAPFGGGGRNPFG
jgi:hypothetical protein